LCRFYLRVFFTAGRQAQLRDFGQLRNSTTPHTRSSEGKSRVELALEGIYGCGCGQNFAPQYPPVIYKPNRKSSAANIRGVGCQRHQQWAAWVPLGLLAPAGALAAVPRQRKLHPRNVLRRPCPAGRPSVATVLPLHAGWAGPGASPSLRGVGVSAERG
jgi:hypothetical protein